MLLRSTLRRNVRRIIRVLHRAPTRAVVSTTTSLSHLRRQAESAFNLLREKPLPKDFDALFLDQLKLRLLEFILQPSPSPAMLLKYFELWAKYLAKAAIPGSPHASLPVFPDPNAGIKPETLAYIEEKLKLM
ncbi:MAG: hypothetical protein WCO56_18860 [Verrucomicrobiota bacterium]